ncbi:MAG: sterol carrier family protein, partial [Micrococcales bacterium]
LQSQEPESSSPKFKGVRRRIKPADGQAAISAVQAGDESQLATAVRFLLEELGSVAPGNTVEVRVPPLGAVQCVQGPRHTRGTPPNVVEMTPEVWFALAVGDLEWDQALAAGQIHASGTRAEIKEHLPLV